MNRDYATPGDLYRVLLLCYPAAHRREYGELMLQLFRDQWRDAARDGTALGPLRFCVRTLFDLILSAASEHLTVQTRKMKNMTPSRQSLLLLIAALSCAVVSIGIGFQGFPMLAIAFAYLSAAGLLARAFTEWFRPSGERWNGIAWAVAVAVAYGFVFPAWAHLRASYGAALPIVAPLQVAALMLNLLVPMLKALLSFGPKRL